MFERVGTSPTTKTLNSKKMNEELEIIGTVESLTGKKGKLQFNSANLKRKGKRVLCNIINSKGQVEVERCIVSLTLSNQLRDQEISLGNLLTLNVAKTTRLNAKGEEETLHYIIQEQGTWEDVEVSVLKAEAITSEDVDISELLAYSL